jgi:hypothetical protein
MYCKWTLVKITSTVIYSRLIKDEEIEGLINN